MQCHMGLRKCTFGFSENTRDGWVGVGRVVVGGGEQQPSKIALRWASSWILLLIERKNSFWNVQIFTNLLFRKSYSDKRDFWPASTNSWLCDSAHTCSQKKEAGHRDFLCNTTRSSQRLVPLLVSRIRPLFFLSFFRVHQLQQDLACGYQKEEKNVLTCFHLTRVSVTRRTCVQHLGVLASFWFGFDLNSSFYAELWLN